MRPARSPASVGTPLSALALALDAMTMGTNAQKAMTAARNIGPRRQAITGRSYIAFTDLSPAETVAGWSRFDHAGDMGRDIGISEQPQLGEFLSLAGRTSIVTGGAMGIGLGIARRLHEAGANVVIADPAPERDEVVGQLNGVRAESALATDTDVGDAASVEAMVRRSIETFGAVDVLINNAGIYPQTPMLEMDEALFRRVIDTNLTGLFLCTRAAARAMVAQGDGGRIVNVTSIDALHPSMVGLSAYDASKHGAWGFTKNTALELASHGIRVNAIAPGGIKTPGVGDFDEATLTAFRQMIPMGRMGEPDEIALAALFLASEMSSYMTGSQIVVDGGRLLR